MLSLPGARRALLHTLAFPAAAGVPAYDARVRSESRLRARYGMNRLGVLLSTVLGARLRWDDRRG